MIPVKTRGWHKYGARSTVVDGIRFASKAEARHYAELKLLERAGKITALELQPKFPVVIRGEHICDYVADFSYRDEVQRRVVDVKGVETPVFRLKKRLVEALYPHVKIEVVK